MPILFWSMIAGLAAGVLSGLFGIGGGIIIVPFLVLVMNYSQQSASGTSLVALLLPVGLLGVLSYYRAGKIGPTEFKAGLTVAFFMFFGTLLGAKLSTRLPEELLRKGFAVFLIFVAVRLWLMKR